jgi:hypothetical protein
MKRSLAFLLCLLFLGACSMPRDYPDWMGGFDGQEDARRTDQGIIMGQTGRVLWSTSFDEGLAEWQADLDPTATIKLTTLRSYSGGTSLYMEAAAGVGNSALIDRFIAPADADKYGVELFFHSALSAYGGYQDFGIALNVKYGDGASEYVLGGVTIRRTASLDGEIMVYTTGGAEIDTGYSVPGFFIHSAGAYNPAWWHYIKYVADYLGAGSYNRILNIDGKEYDLSSWLMQVSTVADGKRYVYLVIGLANSEAHVNACYIDKLVVTYNEP